MTLPPDALLATVNGDTLDISRDGQLTYRGPLRGYAAQDAVDDCDFDAVIIEGPEFSVACSLLLSRVRVGSIAVLRSDHDAVDVFLGGELVRGRRWVNEGAHWRRER